MSQFQAPRYPFAMIFGDTLYPPAPPSSYYIFTDDFVGGWTNSGTNANAQSLSTVQVASGSYSLFNDIGAWANINFKSGSWGTEVLLLPSTYTAVSFSVYMSGSTSNISLYLETVGGSRTGSSQTFTCTANTWEQKSVAISTICPNSEMFCTVGFQEFSGVGIQFFIDDLKLTYA